MSDGSVPYLNELGLRTLAENYLSAQKEVDHLYANLRVLNDSIKTREKERDQAKVHLGEQAMTKQGKVINVKISDRSILRCSMQSTSIAGNKTNPAEVVIAIEPFACQ